MRALRAWKIVEALKLDEATSARLFPILSRYDEREMAIAAERHVIMRDLREATEAAHPDDARLTATLNKLLANRAQQRALHDDRIKDVRKVLTPVQQAKLVLLLPRMEHDFAGWIHEASGRGGGPVPGRRRRLLALALWAAELARDPLRAPNSLERVPDAAAQVEGVVEAAFEAGLPAAQLGERGSRRPAGR